MLTSLTVRDIVLIEKAELQFAPGLNVLTGETGAGKSILLDALGLAAGERGVGRTAIRAGAETSAVAAIFDVEPAHPARLLLKTNALDEASGEIMLRRTLTADGRSRAYVNDQPIGIQLAREIGAALLEVHGQTDDRGLFDVATHRTLLDSFGGHISLAEDVARVYAALASATDKRDALRRAQNTAAQEIDYLTHAEKELRDLAPVPGEEESLAASRALLSNAGRIAQEIAAAADFVVGDAGAEVQLAAALRRLSRLPAEGRKAASAAETSLDSALTFVQEARSELEALLARLENNPAKLENVEERLFALRAAARKYHVPVDSLAALRDEFEAKLASLDASGASIAAAEAEVARTRKLYLEAAARLSARRIAAAKILEGAVAKEFSPLKLGAARFRVALMPIAKETAGAHGFERIAFEIATIEGASFGPLAKIASGGELARFALALKVTLAEASPPAVLVFDEVDRGVGGAVAAAVGERLQRLAETTQVLLVTHSPQVASRAARHFRIIRVKDATRVIELGPEERVEEIARMLSGTAVTDEARAAARRLIAEAQAQRATKKRVRA
jgi:DNA repair protein RecN (Recombination protein N)